jgi:Electron transfer DM13
MPNLPAGWRAWFAIVAFCAITVGAALSAALVGLAAKDTMPPNGSLLSTHTAGHAMPPSFAEAAPPGARVLITAEFRSLDASTWGTAALLDVGGGKTLRLAPFETEAGQECVVYLVPHADARSPGDGALLGPLKGAAGEQNYAVPVGVRTDGPLTVLIWSREFKGPVAHAVLRSS